MRRGGVTRKTSHRLTIEKFTGGRKAERKKGHNEEKEGMGNNRDLKNLSLEDPQPGETRGGEGGNKKNPCSQIVRAGGER